MNQFHTPSFGDEVFELNDTPAESPNQASRRMLSLDQSMLNDDDEEDCDTYGSGVGGGGGHSLLAQPEQQQQHQPLAQAPPKPLAPFALFFRDTVTAIKQQNPACSLEQMQVIVQTMWESLDETQKNIYSQRHEQEKRDYVRLMRGYRYQLSESEATSELEAPPAVAAPSHKWQSMPHPLVTPKVEAVEAPGQAVTAQQPPPEQIQLLTEAARVQKCTREQCNKPAIINPDWEDEYCSNECVVIHCRNVFNDWVLTMKTSPS
ncbi:LOW QUALITY PROTEIN: TOX high mobility group box family member 4 [Drosophila rhopaloa]|uniref:HMG box domain-containing protein n=1 Tax=Drosophila rhopaloa TaxID=1041015 RepID=A0ABM5H0F7_DRORH|nr:LOW QUALITY PROTEIN: TOX high mobility group box family member 4 [Drosophila rhopaloa]